jgi:RNA polymerase sigma factor (sigma-70 family)
MFLRMNPMHGEGFSPALPPGWNRNRADRTVPISSTLCIEHQISSAISPEARAAVNGQLKAVGSAIQRLSERQRGVFLLRFMEDMNILEIAEVTRLTENAIKVHLFRAVRAVRKVVEDQSQ